MALLRTIEQFRDQVVVNVNSDFASFAPDVRLVESERLKPLMGPALFNELSALSTADLAALDGPMGELRDELLCASANLAAAEYLPMQQVQMTDSGVFLLTTGDKKTAFQWQINQLLTAFRRKGYNALERALAILDENIDVPAFAAWATSAAGTASHKFFINTAAQFTEFYGINNSRLTYLALLPTLRKMERFAIEPVLGTDFYLELKEQVLDRDLSADNVLVLEQYIRPALAHLVIAKAVPELGMGLNGNAIELNVYRLDDSNQKEADASIDSLLGLKVQQAAADGQVYLTRLRSYLNTTASATRYAAYFTSTAYQDPSGPRPTVRTEVAGRIYGFM
ncbi:DUF6712 family protein [Hymenobacter terricola]|uniref:DUF6712 family protein n=1 Tax=Hymenobacter terricola TaxID=2819236 RepID=UPI001B300B1A|nr:DUF6712 family protein [Hymenobacter terricola]